MLLYLINPSLTDIAEFFFPFALQFPRGLSLSTANSPSNAILSPRFFNGRIFASFLSKTIDSCAIDSDIDLFEQNFPIALAES